MPLFKKKKEEAPPLPELPPLPPLPEVPGVPEVPEVPAPEKAPTPPPIMRVPTIPKALPKISPVEKVIPPPLEAALPTPERAKVFIRIDKYKDVMRTIEGMQHKINELQKTLDKISSIKTREAEIITGWNALLAEAKTKIDEVGHKLTKPEA